MGIKVKGLDKLNKRFDQLADNARRLANKKEVSFDVLFTDSFMRKYTNFANIDEFEKLSGFDYSDIESIPDSDLDKFVSDNTSFSKWSEMLGKATELYVASELTL